MADLGRINWVAMALANGERAEHDLPPIDILELTEAELKTYQNRARNAIKAADETASLRPTPTVSEDAVERAAKAMYADEIGPCDANPDELWETMASMPLSGPSFVEGWTRRARAALSVSHDNRMRERQCDVCTAIVAEDDEAMSCHCQTVRWRATALGQEDET